MPDQRFGSALDSEELPATHTGWETSRRVRHAALRNPSLTGKRPEFCTLVAGGRG
ncbi:hypothetical protein [Deinococcus hopiensis]|uniref:hypothetical protein n=1 Tax=Deinococcus hopiensis TaxID=309885 RepID=UPI0014835502|nr:hypothetical protein [Deinococcus hopiensis]